MVKCRGEASRVTASRRARRARNKGGGMRGLKDKVVIVTGGAGGIGAALCRRFGAEGAAVAVFDLDGGAADQVAAEIRAVGGKAKAYAVDISNPARVNAAVAETEQALGAIDVLVNNAGWDRAGVFDTDTSCGKDHATSDGTAQHAPCRIGAHGRAAGRVVNVLRRRAGRVLRERCIACGRHHRFLEDDGARTGAQEININVVCPGRPIPRCFAISPARARAAKLKGALAGDSLQPAQPARRRGRRGVFSPATTPHSNGQVLSDRRSDDGRMSGCGWMTGAGTAVLRAVSLP
jgi:2-hydroxycyclohexanecarboxyl-CoA dehydrogenase